MRLLLHEWNSFTGFDIKQAFREEGIDFDTTWLNARTRSQEETIEFMEKFDKLLKNKEYDAVFSINFQPPMAEVCHNNKVMYIAWTYDSPALCGFEHQHYFDTNRVFLFDSAELALHKKMNKPHLYHLNLATNVKRMNSIKMTPMQQLRFQSEISFVGQMYTTELHDMMQSMSPYAVGFLQALVDMQMKDYDSNLIRNLITDEVIDAISNPELIEKMEKYNEFFSAVAEGQLRLAGFRSFLQRAVTNRERLMILSLLSKHYSVRLFSRDRHEVLENVTYAGAVDYRKEMPLIFKNSKINLNITAKNIENGIPQRCIDVLGCHGFLLTNYQEDLFTEFEEEKDVVTYKSMEEAVDKAGFYLKHDQLRNEIAHNGYKKVRDLFNYHTQLAKIWKITGLK